MLIRVYLIPFAKQSVRTLNVNIIYYLFRNEKRAASYDSFQGRYSAAAAAAAGDNIIWHIISFSNNIYRQCPSVLQRIILTTLY